MLADNEARFIAAQWASGGDAFQVFASTGAIVPELLEEISTNAGLCRLQYDGDASADELDRLAEYVNAAGLRPEIPGWGDLPECDEERIAREVWDEQNAVYNQIVREGLGLR